MRIGFVGPNIVTIGRFSAEAMCIGPLSLATTSAAPATSASAKPDANQAEVHVYNISPTSGVAARTKDQLVAAGFKVTTAENLSVPEVSATTVYYTDGDGEKATADAVGEKLGAQVEPRIDAIKNQPAGVIVLAVG